MLENSISRKSVDVEAKKSGSSYLAQLFQLAQCHLAFEAREVVDEQHAFEVVHFVLQTRGHQPVHVLFVVVAIKVLPARADA